MRKPTFLFPTWSDTNQAVQLQKMARCLKFRIKEVEGLNYPCSDNKGADQLRSYREVDLRLRFRICKMLGSNGHLKYHEESKKRKSGAWQLNIHEQSKTTNRI